MSANAGRCLANTPPGVPPTSSLSDYLIHPAKCESWKQKTVRNRFIPHIHHFRSISLFPPSPRRTSRYTRRSTANKRARSRNSTGSIVQKFLTFSRGTSKREPVVPSCARLVATVVHERAQLNPNFRMPLPGWARFIYAKTSSSNYAPALTSARAFRPTMNHCDSARRTSSERM